MSAIRTSGSKTSPEQKQPSPKTQKLGDDDDNKVKLFPFKGFEIEQQFEMTHEDSLRYNKQVKESGGFDVEAFHPCSYCIIRPLKKLNMRLRKKLERYSKRAIAEFNLKNSTNFQFVKVHKANARVVSGLVYYITFAAKDPAATEFEIFQVMEDVMRAICLGKMSAIRTSGSETSPEQKQPSPKKQKLGDDDDNKVKLFPFKGFEKEQQFQMSHEDSLRYNEQVKESGGFDVETFPNCSNCIIRPLGKLDKRLRKKLECYSKRAIAEFNLKNSTNFQFVKVHKANARPVSGLVYYITFAAKDPAATEFEIFQVSLHAPIAADIKIYLCRIKPKA
ncbi:hypothetical protein ACSBR2_016250 [Camellia fascicularis]